MRPCLTFSCNRASVILSAQRAFHSRARECDRGARECDRRIGANVIPAAGEREELGGQAGVAAPCVCQPWRVAGWPPASTPPRSEKPATRTVYDLYQTVVHSYFPASIVILRCKITKVAPARRLPPRPSARAYVRAQPPPHAEHRRARDDRHPSPSINARHPSSTAAAASSTSTITHTRPRARLPFQCTPLNLHALARTFVRGCAPRGRP